MSMKYGTDIHGAEKMEPNDSVDFSYSESQHLFYGLTQKFVQTLMVPKGSIVMTLP